MQHAYERGLQRQEDGIRPLSVIFIVLETADIPLFFSCRYEKVPWYKELHRLQLSPMSEANTGLCVCHSWQLILTQAQMASARLDHLKCSSTDADTFSIFLSSTPYLPLRTDLTAYSSFADRFLAPSIVSLSSFFLLIVDFIFDVKKCVHGFLLLFWPPLIFHTSFSIIKTHITWYSNSVWV